MFKRSAPADRLREIGLFGDCTDAELAAIDANLTLVNVEAGTTVVHEGGFGTEVLVVVEGELAVTRHSPTGERVVARLGKGDVIGEMALLERARRSASVTALTPSVLLAGNTREFATLMSVPSVALKLRALATRRAKANRARAALAA